MVRCGVEKITSKWDLGVALDYQLGDSIRNREGKASEPERVLRQSAAWAMLPPTDPSLAHQSTRMQLQHADHHGHLHTVRPGTDKGR